MLDNLEQLLPEVAVVAELAAEFAGVDMLATSREPLRIGAEREYSVPPLVAAEAVTLFAERAALSSMATVRAVAAICARLDELPLAIELAAAREGAPRRRCSNGWNSGCRCTGGARDAPEPANPSRDDRLEPRPAR